MTIAPFGAGALAALAEAVARAKGGDPLAPVTIVVPTDRMAVAARRGLARAGIAGRSGITGITVVSLRRLAESVASATLAASGRLPVTDPVLLAALDRGLAVEPGAFVEVADHPETTRTLAAAHRSLRGLPVPVVEAIAGCSALAADVVRMHRGTTDLLAADYFDEADLLAAATARVPESAGGLPPVVLYLPDELDPLQARFVAALGMATDVRVILGATGDPALDQAAWAAWRSVLPAPAVAGGAMPAPAGVLTGPPVADAVIAATDPDAEVRAVVRHLVDRLGTGTPGHRMAILYGSRDPYARLLAEHLAAAGVTFNGRGVRPATERILGRAIRRLLALPDVDFRRDAVLAVLADAPVRWEGERVPSTSWERLSRQSGWWAAPPGRSGSRRTPRLSATPRSGHGKRRPRTTTSMSGFGRRPARNRRNGSRRSSRT